MLWFPFDVALIESAYNIFGGIVIEDESIILVFDMFDIFIEHELRYIKFFIG